MYLFSSLIIIIFIKVVVIVITQDVVLLLVHKGPEVADQHSPSAILITSVHYADCFVFRFFTFNDSVGTVQLDFLNERSTMSNRLNTISRLVALLDEGVG